MGTACYIKGAANLLKAVEQVAGVKAGETTPDNKMSLVTARCLGSCGLAPAVVFDGDVVGKMEPQDMQSRLRGWIGHDA
jgi:bidirectional [NiFe] hydrogenase diaphorase subunit